jgi:hypothetical protein
MLIATSGGVLVAGWALFAVGLLLLLLSVLVLVIVLGNVHATREAIRAGAAPIVGIVIGIGMMIAGLTIVGVDLPGVG